MKLDISRDINNLFHVDKLYLTNNNSLFSQPVNDLQFSPIQKNSMEEFVIKNIMTKIIIKIKKKQRKKYKIK